MQTAVNIKRKVKVSGVWKFAPVVKVGKGYNPALVLIDGVPVKPESGTFYIEWWEGKRRIQKAVGTHWRDVLESAKNQQKRLELRAAGIDSDPIAHLTDKGKTLASSIEYYVEHTPLRKKSKLKYRNALAKFCKWCPKSYLSQIGRNDIIEFMSAQRAVGMAPKTILDDCRIIVGVLRSLGGKIEMIRGDWPRVTLKEPDVYNDATLRTLFQHANPEEYLLFQTFRATGFRDQEVGFLSWDDLNEKNETLAVTQKLDLGFEPKEVARFV